MSIKYITLAEARERWPDPRKPFREGMTIRDAGGQLYSVRGSPFDHSVLYCTKNGVMRFDGGPPRLVSVGPWIPKGALKPGDIVRVQGERQTIQFTQRCDPRSWITTRYQKEKTMKPGPYKSSTHGNINVSMKARELLDDLRKAVTGAIAGDDFNANGQALSRARGEIAQHIADLELTLREKLSAEQAKRLAEGYGAKPRPGLTYLCGDFHAGMDFELDTSVLDALKNMNKPIHLPWLKTSPFNPLRYKKETPVTDEKTPPPKTRSQLIAESTGELLSAQQHLESINSANAGRPSYIRLSTSVLGNQCELNAAISALVAEQWAALVKKAAARAKARVSKAEKAVAALLS